MKALVHRKFCSLIIMNLRGKSTHIFYLFIILCNLGHAKVIIDCGSSKNHSITVTCTDDVYQMFSTVNEIDCVAIKRNNTLVLENINKRPECGMKWNDNNKTFSVKLHIQKNLIITEEDKIVHVTCFYGEKMSTSVKKIEMMDRWVYRGDSTILRDSGLGIEIPGSEDITADTLDITVKLISDTGTVENVTQVQEGEKITLQINSMSVDISGIQVTECHIEDVQDRERTFYYEIIHESCGTGYPLKTNQYFKLASDKSLLEIEDGFIVPHLAFLEYIVFRCRAFILPPGAYQTQVCDQMTLQDNFQGMQQDLFSLLTSGVTQPIRITEPGIGADTDTQNGTEAGTQTGTEAGPEVGTQNVTEEAGGDNLDIIRKFRTIQGNDTTVIIIKGGPNDKAQDYFHFLIIIAILSFLLLGYTVIVIYMCSFLYRKHVGCTTDIRGCNSSRGSSEAWFLDVAASVA